METIKDDQPNDELLMLTRLVPIKRVDNKVFARSLRYGEEDSGERVHLEAGDQLIIPAGELVIDTREIDAQSVEGEGGYAPVANTIWTWYRFAPAHREFYDLFFALARRMDAAHYTWTLAIQERGTAKEKEGISRRIGYFNTLSLAEVTIIALHRAMSMLHRLNSDFCLGLEVPKGVGRVWKIVEELRHGFEHIDRRAAGKSGPSLKEDPDAWTIFHQADFFESLILRYKGNSLRFYEDVRTTLLECREMMMKAIDAKVRVDSGSKEVGGDRN